jgi:hypothetical protein
MRGNTMTRKQNPILLDIDSCILHSAQTGIPFEEYVERVARDGRKKIKVMVKGLKE